jgi:hypothetical protein
MWDRTWSRFATLSSVILLIAGCASMQLNYNTSEIANTIDSFLTQQVLTNIGRFVNNNIAIPSMVTLASGTVQTTNTITPALTDPLTNTVATTNQLARVIGGATTSTASVLGTSTGTGLSITATDTWQQSWITNPIIENHILRRLRSLYRFAVLPNMDQDQLICEYQVVVTGKPVEPGKPSGKYWIPCDAKGEVALVATDYSPVDPDPNFIKRPGCVICEPLPSSLKVPNGNAHCGPTNRNGISDGHVEIVKPSAAAPKGIPPKPDVPIRSNILVLNEKLCNGWLIVKDFPIREEDEYYLGFYGGHHLYVKDDQKWAFYQFILFVLEATVEKVPGLTGSSDQTSRQSQVFFLTRDAKGHIIAIPPPGKNSRQ